MNELTVETLKAYTEEDATRLGELMTSLSTNCDGSAIDRELFEAIIAQPDGDQLVARLRGRIVGAASLSTIMGPAAGRVAFLNDFVTDVEVQGQGIGGRLWDEVERWCIERGLSKLTFHSRAHRQAAHRFYSDHGAVPVETIVLQYFPGSGEHN